MPFTLTLESFHTYPGSDVIRRVSTSAAGGETNADSHMPRFSGNGRYIVFHSDAPFLVPGDTNGKTDVFRKDLWTGEIIRVSTNAQGAEGNGDSIWGSSSADGRYIVFMSYASNLVSGGTNQGQVFVKDLGTGEVGLVSSSDDGTRANKTSGNPVVSANGMYVTFVTDADNLVSGDGPGTVDLFRKSLITGEVVRVAAGNGVLGYGIPSISADGRYIAFESDASNLVVGDTNGRLDVFRMDVLKGELIRVSTDSDGGQTAQGAYASKGTMMSADGRYIVFEGHSDDLVAGDQQDLRYLPQGSRKGYHGTGLGGGEWSASQCR